MLYKVLVTQSCSQPGSSVYMIFPGKNKEVGSHCLLQGIFPHPGMELASPVSHALQADYLPAEPWGKPHRACALLLSYTPTYKALGTW